MAKKLSLILDNEFIQYCKLNDIEDIEKLAKEVFTKGFTMLKYGDRPGIVSNEIIPVIPLGPPTGLKTLHKIEVKSNEKSDLYGE